MNLCLTCSPTSTYYSKVQFKADWVTEQDHAGPAVIPTSKGPSGASLRLRFRVPPELANQRQVVWWGANPVALPDAHQPSNPPADAYDMPKWSNSGCVTVDNEIVEVCCRAPQPYKEGDRRWPRHIHLMGVDGGSVNPAQTFTVGVWPSAQGELADYTCEHLEGADHAQCMIVSFNQVKACPDVCTVDATGQGHNIFESEKFHSVKHDSPDMERVGKDIGDSPVVVFCANPTCNAARKLIHAWQVRNLCPNYFYMHEGYDSRPTSQPRCSS